MEFQILSWASLVSGFVAALTLFWAGIGKTKSWKETSAHDIRLKRRQKALKWIGFPSMLGSFGCQVALKFMEAQQ